MGRRLEAQLVSLRYAPRGRCRRRIVTSFGIGIISVFLQNATRRFLEVSVPGLRGLLFLGPRRVVALLRASCAI